MSNNYRRMHLIAVICCLYYHAPICLLFSVSCLNLTEASNNIHTPSSTDCSLNKMKFLVLRGYSQLQSVILWSQLNMAVIGFTHTKCRRKSREPSVISEMLGIWNDSFPDRSVYWSHFFFQV